MKAQLVKHASGYILFDEKGIPIGATPNVLSNGTFGKLSLKNCQAIERGYDLDELAEENTSDCDASGCYPEDYFKEGFQKSLELMGDKKFSEEDIRKAFGYGIDVYAEPNNWDKLNPYQKLDKLIQSLQQTEWDVEVEMEEQITAKARQLHGDIVSFKLLENAVFPKPKLDADGCLILKKI